MHKLLIANRGEIAVRVIESAAAMGIATVAIAPEDDASCLHADRGDEFVQLRGSGASAYLDIEAITRVAVEMSCDAVHPGYGFLSENPDFVRSLDRAGIGFVGPSVDALERFGDKSSALAVARELGVPVLAGTTGATTLSEAEDFIRRLGPDATVMVKALAGGGGRGMAPVLQPGDLEGTYARCSAEATMAFGRADLYVEQLLNRARHIEVQVLADGQGGVVVLGDRDCSVQRRRQKLIEVAPAVWTSAATRGRLHEAAIRMIGSGNYSGLATVEFLVQDDDYFFLEVNPRIQVEHTVTEATTGLDLVQAALRISDGESLASLGLDETPPATGVAIQARVNAEVLRPDGTVHAGTGQLTTFQPPLGRNVRVDTHGQPGSVVSPRYDSLLAKVIVTERDIAAARDKLARALADFKIRGVPANLPVLQALLAGEQFVTGQITTSYVDDQLKEILEGLPPSQSEPDERGQSAAPAAEFTVDVPPDAFGPGSHLQGVIVEIPVREGDDVGVGTELCILEAMKMQHVITADRGGVVTAITREIGDLIDIDDVVVWLLPGTDEIGAQSVAAEIDLETIRPDLAESIERHRIGLDEGRPTVVDSRHRQGRRTARENIDALVDPGSFVEYGSLAIAAQRRRRTEQDLIERTPADGIVLGTAMVSGTPIAVFAYDYTVLAGTQGYTNHRKMDRLFRVADQLKLPIVIFAEGGGGRPGDTDKPNGPGLIGETFLLLAAMVGKVPIVGVVAGYSFAGNAALVGSCDVVIATKDSSIGMGGPAMIEGGGLGVHDPRDIGPMRVQYPNGVVDIVVDDEVQAVRRCRQVLQHLTSSRLDEASGESPADQRTLRHFVPENRLRSYDMRPIIDTLVDPGSLIELRQGFGVGMITSLARVDGTTIGILANNPHHLGGAIDAQGADKATRFLTMCQDMKIPLLSLCDTPGFMVGPDSERDATVRRFGAFFVAGARLTTPKIMVVTRKGYGLGAMAMAGGSLLTPLFTVAWPTGEFGGMGLEGAVRLGFRKELEAITDPQRQAQRYNELLEDMYQTGKATNIAAVYEIDDVIDPADTRALISQSLKIALK
ncbi:acetyl/propionyl-CoA carboxylase alpha subunit [Antricoccus suffuscus]|uniref:acetyl-CoA carboxylase n=1 Tax=Antricoccus suffuscus TaxID=1629062 RepID=A0A2T0ZXA1_9ACTN|nr:carboxyl transferase domain-containing protein [Antricoccus suffuscus]PRZ40867.1 acetyl/propionyl-CoA carboxylase alpha subunit [Antricoccus suffuscus]